MTQHATSIHPFIDAKPPKPDVVLGTTGLKHFSGVIDEEFLHRLRGRNAVLLFNEMQNNSPTIAAALNVIKWLIRRVDWRFDPADDSNEAKREADETQGAVEDMSHTFTDFISEALSFMPFGWSYFEIIYKLRKGPSDDPTVNSKFTDGKFGWRKFEIRSQDTLDRWVFDDEGGLLGLVQQDYYQQARSRGPVFIPIGKSLLFRTETAKGNPEGKSLIRPAVLPYHYIKRIQEIEAIGIERDLAGMPIMEVPFEVLLDDAPADLISIRNKLERFITQVRRDERWGGLVPSEDLPDGQKSGYKFKLMTTGGKRQIETNEILRRYDSRILMLFLAQFLLLGQDKVGSLSLASSMTDLFALGIEHFMDIIATTINRFAVRRRQALNNRPPELDPKLTHGDIEKPDLDQLARYVTTLSTVGMLPATDAVQRKLLELGELPQPDEGEKVDQGPTASGARRQEGGDQKKGA